MKLPQHIRGAIFDLDGTLLNSLNAWRDVDEIFFRRRGLALPEDYFYTIKTLDLYEAALYTKARFSLPDEPQAMINEWSELIREEYALRVELKPDARELLETLYLRGVKLAIATSSARELFLPCLMRQGADKLFSAYVTTADVGRGKEFPDVYLRAAEKLGLSSHACAVFEDILIGIRSARASGFFSVAVFDAHSSAEQEALKREADLYVTEFRELLP